MRCTKRHPITKIMAHVAIFFLAMVTVGVKPAVADDAAGRARFGRKGAHDL